MNELHDLVTTQISLLELEHAYEAIKVFRIQNVEFEGLLDGMNWPPNKTGVVAKYGHSGKTEGLKATSMDIENVNLMLELRKGHTIIVRPKKVLGFGTRGREPSR